MKTIPVTTFLLIALNVAFFFLTFFSLSAHESAISNYGISVPLEHAYAFLTYMFIHSNVPHIALNAFFLGDIGVSYEKRIGSVKFLFIYFISGIFAGIFSFVYLSSIHAHETDPTIVVGASGAIFGLLSYVLIIRDGIDLFLKKYVPIIAVIHIPLLMADMPIAWYAHLGGAIAGTILSFIVPSDKPLLGSWEKTKKRNSL